MPHYAPTHFSHERDREPRGGTQCGNDELLCLIADCQSLERSGRNLGDGADIGVRFTSDEYVAVTYQNSSLGCPAFELSGRSA